MFLSTMTNSLVKKSEKENINKKIEVIKIKNQMEIRELQNAMY